MIRPKVERELLKYLRLLKLNLIKNGKTVKINFVYGSENIEQEIELVENRLQEVSK